MDFLFKLSRSKICFVYYRKRKKKAAVKRAKEKRFVNAKRCYAGKNVNKSLVHRLIMFIGNFSLYVQPLT